MIRIACFKLLLICTLISNAQDTLQVEACGITFYEYTIKDHGTVLAIWRQWPEGPSARIKYHEQLIHSIDGVKLKNLNDLRKFVSKPHYGQFKLQTLYYDSYKKKKYIASEYPYVIQFTNEPYTNEITGESCIFGTCYSGWSKQKNKDGWVIIGEFLNGKPYGQCFINIEAINVNGEGFFSLDDGLTAFSYTKDAIKYFAGIKNKNVNQVIIDNNFYYNTSKQFSLNQLLNASKQAIISQFITKENYESMFTGYKLFYDTLTIPIWEVTSPAYFYAFLENGKIKRIDTIKYANSNYIMVGNFSVINKKVSGNGTLQYRLNSYDKNFETYFTGSLKDNKPVGKFSYQNWLKWSYQGNIQKAWITANAYNEKILGPFFIQPQNTYQMESFGDTIKTGFEISKFHDLVRTILDKKYQLAQNKKIQNNPTIKSNSKPTNTLSNSELYLYSKQAYDEIKKQMSTQSHLRMIEEGLLDCVNTGNDKKNLTIVVKPGKTILINAVTINKNGIYILVSDGNYPKKCDEKKSGGMIHFSTCMYSNPTVYEKKINVTLGVDGQREPVYFFIADTF
ncbi:MAG: hypothetical protein ACOVO1_06410 [Chitinophagaceae bacterium]